MSSPVNNQRPQRSCLTSPLSTPLGRRQLGPFSSRATKKAVAAGGRGALTNAFGKGAKRSTKGSMRGPKRHPQHVTFTISYDEDDNDKEADDFNEEHAVVVERDLKHQARQPADHFERLLEVT
jgi:hypothetical protein